MSNKISVQPLAGFMELLPGSQIAFNYMLKDIQNTYELFGYRPIDTPIIERADVLLAKGGGETEKQIYQFEKGKTSLALRFDLTVPLARYVAKNQDVLVFPFKRYAIGKVFRGEKPQAGRFREFYQCDIDVIGRESLDLSYDAEIPAIISETFKKLGFQKFTISVNNRKILNGFFEELSLSKNASEILRILDKVEKASKEEIIESFKKEGIEKEQIEKILTLTNIDPSNPEKLFKELRKINKGNKIFAEGIDELEFVTKRMEGLGVNRENFKIDLTIARGLDYYTGTVYETKLDEYPDIGSVCSGGRYDDLASYYTNNRYPGVGISIGLTRLFDQLERRNLIKDQSETPTKVLILTMTEEPSISLELIRYLRLNNIPSEIFTDFRKGLKYASSLKIPFVVFIGEEEVQGNYYTLKNMQEGKQSTYKEKSDLLKILKE